MTITLQTGYVGVTEYGGLSYIKKDKRARWKEKTRQISGLKKTPTSFWIYINKVIYIYLTNKEA